MYIMQHCVAILKTEILKYMFGFQGQAIDFSMYFKNKARRGHR